MLAESNSDPAHRYLLCNYYFSKSNIEKIKADVRRFMIDRNKDNLYYAFIEWKKKPNEIIVLTMYAYADMLLPKQYDILFQIDNPDNYIIGSFVINQAIFNGLSPVSQIDHGHKHIVVIEFPEKIPEIFNLLPAFEEKFESNTPELGFCSQVNFESIKKLLTHKNNSKFKKVIVMPFPIDIKYIVETEQELGFIFPDSFKNKMAQENGGELTSDEHDWQLFPFYDKSDKKRISRTCNHIVLETKQARSWNNFPGNGVAIASNGAGDNLVLLPTENDNKKLSDEIYLWRHETGEVEKIANNIDELTEE
jgi:hypothetical protein